MRYHFLAARMVPTTKTTTKKKKKPPKTASVDDGVKLEASYAAGWNIK